MGPQQWAGCSGWSGGAGMGLLHVGVGKPAHERVGADHLLGADSGGELGVAVAKLVDVDGDHVGVVVELDESLESLTFESCLHFNESFLLHFVDGFLDGALLGDRQAKHAQCVVTNVVGKVTLNLL